MQSPAKLRLNAKERAIMCATLALDKKAFDVKILEISRLSSIADYLVIATGKSDKQDQAIADSIKQGLKKFGKALDVEGVKEGNWIVIDYGDVIVHVFHEELRRYYDLDGLWHNAPSLDIPDESPMKGPVA
jgi:ribosome-associated protein